MGSNSSCSFAIMVQHLLAAADRYGLDRLKLLCESKLCDEITVETVPTTLSLAEQHRCTQLKAACLKFAAANLNGASSCRLNHFQLLSFHVSSMTVCALTVSACEDVIIFNNLVHFQLIC